MIRLVWRRLRSVYQSLNDLRRVGAFLGGQGLQPGIQTRRYLKRHRASVHNITSQSNSPLHHRK